MFDANGRRRNQSPRPPSGSAPTVDIRDVLHRPSLPLGMFTLDGRVLFINLAPRIKAGGGADEAIGKFLWETPWFDYPGANKEYLRAVIDRAAAGEVCQCELTAAFDGEAHRTFGTTLGPLLDAYGKVTGVIASNMDVTGATKPARLRDTSQLLLEGIVEHLPVMVFVKQADDLRFSLFNRAAEDILGYSRAQMLGKSDYDFWPKDQADSFTAADRMVLASDQVKKIDLEPIRTANGETRFLRTWKAALRDASGEPAHLLGISVDITDEVKTLEELRLSEEKLRGLYRLSPLGIALTDKTGKYIEYNDAFRKICGYPDNELKALDYWKLTPPEYAEQEQEQLRSLESSGRYGPYEKEYVQKGGKRVPIRLNGISVLGTDGEKYIWSIVEDITEQKRTEDDILRLLERVELATAAGKVGIWEYRMGPDEIIWDARMFELYGLDESPEPQKLSRWVDAIHPDDRARMAADHEVTASTGQIMDAEFRIVRPTGEVRHIRAHANVLKDASGKPVRMVGTNWDVTEIRSLAMQLEKEKEISDKASQAKSEFLATMSHELRTPLNAIVGFSDVILSEVYGPLGTPKYSEYVKYIHTSGKLLSSLIDGLLDLARIEAGNLTIANERIDVCELMEECVQIFRKSWGEKLPELKSEAPASGIHLNGDRQAISRVLLNLLSNAAKNTPETGTICVCVGSGGEQVSISVKDTGVGISSEAISNLGEKFVRIDNDKSPRRGGTGLGLFICRSLVELHGGSLSISSEIGKGTEVVVRLPRKREPLTGPELVS